MSFKSQKASQALQFLINHYDENGPGESINWEKLKKSEGSKTLMMMWEPYVKLALFNEDKKALEMILDRLDGKPRQAVEMEIEDKTDISARLKAAKDAAKQEL